MYEVRIPARIVNDDPEQCDCGKGDWCPLWDTGNPDAAAAERRDARIAARREVELTITATGGECVACGNPIYPYSNCGRVADEMVCLDDRCYGQYIVEAVAV